MTVEQGGFRPWARGTVLDLRLLKEGAGWVTELDYEALTPTQFDLNVIRARLADYHDQELVSHMVPGVHILANIELQLVLLPHLLSMMGIEEAVLEDVMRLTRPPYEWIGFSTSLPFAPDMFIGKAIVEKKGGGHHASRGGWWP